MTSEKQQLTPPMARPVEALFFQRQRVIELANQQILETDESLRQLAQLYADALDMPEIDGGYDFVGVVGGVDGTTITLVSAKELEERQATSAATPRSRTPESDSG